MTEFIFFIVGLLLGGCIGVIGCMSMTAFAAGGDPLTVINNLSDFIFGLIRAIGLILLGFGIVQVGLSLKSHDPSQRAKSFKFTDINYAVASREDKEAMFLEYSELLNSFDSGATTKITINNRRLNRLDFEKTILLPLKGDELGSV